MTSARRTLADPGDGSALDRIAEFLAQGGILAYPTETVYGLGGLCRPGPVRRLQALKGRDPERPFLLLLAGSGGDGPEGDGPEGDGPTGDGPTGGGPAGGGPGGQGLVWTPAAETLARRFWPGPLTLVLADPDHRFPSGVRSREGGVAVRVSPHPFLRALLPRLEAPLMSTSANRPGGPPARSAHEAEALLGELPGGDEVLLADGGELPPSEPSTLVDCTGREPVVLREGAVSRHEVERAVATHRGRGECIREP